MADEAYWTYKASSPTPSYEEAWRAKAFNGTEKDWYSLSPGMRREIMRANGKKQNHSQANTSYNRLLYVWARF